MYLRPLLETVQYCSFFYIFQGQRTFKRIQSVLDYRPGNCAVVSRSMERQQKKALPSCATIGLNLDLIVLCSAMFMHDGLNKLFNFAQIPIFLEVS